VSLINVEIAKSPALPLDALTPIPDVIDRARSGDRAAFAELYDTHCDAVYRYVLYRVREPSEVLVLRFVENMSSRQVAKVLGKNEGAIRALQFRALGRLRKLLTEQVA
jgi:DNA-directed RNA polymerase specialized sigma24 family protein